MRADIESGPMLRSAPGIDRMLDRIRRLVRGGWRAVAHRDAAGPRLDSVLEEVTRLLPRMLIYALSVLGLLYVLDRAVMPG